MTIHQKHYENLDEKQLLSSNCLNNSLNENGSLNEEKVKVKEKNEIKTEIVEDKKQIYQMPNKTVEQNLTTNCDLNVTRETQANDILILKNNSSTLERLINCNSDNSLKSIQNEKKFEITENFYSTFDLILK